MRDHRGYELAAGDTLVDLGDRRVEYVVAAIVGDTITMRRLGRKGPGRPITMTEARLVHETLLVKEGSLEELNAGPD